jgi:protein N-terminal methyltransferase
MGLEDWHAAAGVQYDLIWIQWCFVHLTDEQLVAFLQRCKAALNPDGGLMVVKENNSTTGEDEFDDVDSSVTRSVFLCCQHELEEVADKTGIAGMMAHSDASSTKPACVLSSPRGKRASKRPNSSSCPSECTHSS